MELHTSRLILRPFRMGDIPDLAAYTTRPEFTRFIPLPPQTLESAAAFVERAVAEGQPDQNSNWKFVIQRREDAHLIGTIRVGIREANHFQGDVGYALNPDYWGQGYVTEALKGVLKFGFGDLNLVRIYAMADLRNTASWSVMERVGMRREGILRRHRLHQGEWRDSVLYAAISGEV